ncbi:MAG: hypothetical protein AAF639_03020 [Chloroflexota bacterium]
MSEINVGNISNSTGVAVGSNIRQNINTGTRSIEESTTIEKLLAELFAFVKEHLTDKKQRKKAKDQLSIIEAEMTKVDGADDKKVAGAIRKIGVMDSQMTNQLIEIFKDPIMAEAIGPITEYELSQLGE